MGYTEFYQNMQNRDIKLTWRDILNESFRKHNYQDLEYALSAGTVHDQASGATMLQKWHKPWVWLRILCILAGISAALYLMILVLLDIETNIPAIGWMFVLFATMITPLPFMILLWEMNIPRNISLFSMAGYFVAGGILSLCFSAFFFAAEKEMEAAWWAPLAEEPGKLLAGIVLLYFAGKHGKEIYGCTGLTIGAGVGAGFTIFETLGYAFNQLADVARMIMTLPNLPVNVSAMAASVSPYVTRLIFIRSVPDFAGHLVYCAPYIGAFALAFRETHSWIESLKDRKFLALFCVSCLLHGLWNWNPFPTFSIPFWIVACLISAAGLFALFYTLRCCLAQVIKEGFALKGISVYCKSGILRGTVWQSNGEVLIAGRDRDVCSILFPADTKGVSGQHCRLFRTDGSWFVQDMGSSYGTYAAGRKLEAYQSCPIRSGDDIFLGSKQVQLTVL